MQSVTVFTNTRGLLPPVVGDDCFRDTVIEKKWKFSRDMPRGGRVFAGACNIMSTPYLYCCAALLIKLPSVRFRVIAPFLEASRGRNWRLNKKSFSPATTTSRSDAFVRIAIDAADRHLRLRTNGFGRSKNAAERDTTPGGGRAARRLISRKILCYWNAGRPGDVTKPRVRASKTNTLQYAYWVHDVRTIL